MKNKSKGLGDMIDSITTKTGIKKVVNKISEATGIPCNCEERKQKLNQMFPNFRNIRQFTEDEIKIYDEVVPGIEKRQRLNAEEKTIIAILYKGVFGQNPQWKSCSPCNKQIMENLKKVYEKSCKV
tara:strand:+ start:807 stop:1184 length:378 start_codon:yes stop_codon:yes gene_type:complete